MRILVTGGAGYIGSITTRELLDAGHECVVLDSLVNGHREAVDRRAEFVLGSVGDQAVLGEVLPGCDAVMHLAGLIDVAESEREPDRYWDSNLQQPLAMLDAMRIAGVSAMVFSSTAAVYGEPARVPISEQAPARPVSVYGQTKRAFEQALDAHAAHGLRSVRLRYFNVAGALPDGSLGEAHLPETHIIPRVLTAILNGEREFEVFGGDYPTPDGTCIRDYIHVLDLAQAHRLALEWLHDGRPGGAYNLGNGTGFTNLQVVRACAEAGEADVRVRIGPRRSGDPAVLVASSAKARHQLGWSPRRSDLPRMVEDALSWHRAHPTQRYIMFDPSLAAEFTQR